MPLHSDKLPLPSPKPATDWLLAAGCGVIVAATLLAYANSFRTPFVFDDRAAIVDNASIRDLGSLGNVLAASGPVTAATGRPLVNLSLALNYRCSGLDPWSYHLFNVSIHALAGLTLFGIVRRTVWQRQGPTPWPVALAIALLWALHPLQTEAVTSVIQRTESLCGLCYLLTLYCFARGVASPRPGIWLTGSVLVCWLGMAAKEVMVSAPLIVLLYDRTFMAGSFASAWKQRRPWYLALGASWLLLACLVAAGGGTRGTAAGFGVGVASWSYLLKQSEAIVLYLKLSFWPDPLVLDYGTAVARSMLEVWWQGPLVLGLLAGTVWALWRRPAAGFLGAWFFLILAPSSSVLPLAAQTMAEHRMYLPLAAVIAAVGAMTWKVAGSRSAVIWGLLALVAGIFTHRRNTVYHDELTLWSDTTANYPSNPRAWTNLGSALLDADRPGDAVAAFEHAGRLEPDSPETQANLGLACLRLGRLAEAVQHGEVALQLDPANVNAQINLAHALVQSGQAGRAIAYYEAALRAQPGALDVQINLADALLDLGRVAEAMQHYRSALPLESRRAEIRCKLATACIRLHDLAGGRRECSEALRLRPDYAEAHFVWGNLCAAAEDFVPAIAAYRRAVSLEPDHLAARNNLANALLVSQRLGEAIAEYREVLRRRPADRSVQENLQSALDLQAAELGRGK